MRDYSSRIARNNNISPEDVSVDQIKEARAKDSTRAHQRRNTVLHQWLKNSGLKQDNPAIKNKISQECLNAQKKLKKLSIKNSVLATSATTKNGVSELIETMSCLFDK